MATYKCQLCNEPIQQKDEVFRAIIERAKKKKGDPSDPTEWTDVVDWTDIFISHSECVQAEVADREARVEIPGEDAVAFLFEEATDEHEKPNLKIM